MRILLIEDDAQTAAFVRDGLKEASHAVDHASTGRDGLSMAMRGSYNAIVLDRMLPDPDGLAIVCALREAGNRTPVLMLTALGDVDHRVEGLRAGADDYLVKPFAFAELSARIDGLARRAQSDPRDSAPVRLMVEDLELDLIRHQASRNGRPIVLLPREYRLLEYLMRHAGQTVTRTMLLEAVWDYHFDPQTNVIEVHISRLRQKIDHGLPKPLLHTLRGVGYRLGD